MGGIILINFILGGCMKDKVEIKNTKSFSFSYSVGYYMNASYSYQLELTKDSKYIISYKPTGFAEEDRFYKEVSKNTVEELEQILIKHDISRWDGFHKVDKRVLDGNDFSLNYYTENRENISASGYMKYPDGYKDFQNDIVKFYTKLFKDEIKELVP